MTAVTDAIAALDRFLEVAEVAQRDRLLAPHERRLAAQMRTAFRNQEYAFMRRLDTIADQFEVVESIQRRSSTPHAWLAEAAEPQWEQLLLEAMEETRPDFEQPIAAAIAQVYPVAAGAQIAKFSVSIAFDLDHPRARAYLSRRPALATNQINTTTAKAIRKIVLDGFNNRKTYTEIGREIGDKFQEYRKSVPWRHVRDRAEGIAIYELGAAYEQGGNDLVQEMQAWGMQMEHAWLSVGDSRVRPEHKANQAEGWLPLNTAFSSGHLMPPTDGACRCASLYRRKPSV